MSNRGRKSVRQQLREVREELDQCRAAQQSLAQAVNQNSPLVLAVAVDRLTGKPEVATSIDQDNPEPDVRKLLDAIGAIEKFLHDQLLSITEERIRQELTKEESEGDDTPDNDHPELEGGEADAVSDRAGDEPAAA